MKKFFLVLFLGILLIAPMISAFDFDNIKSFTKDETTSKYGKIEIHNSFLIPKLIKGEKLWEAELTNNTDVCGEECSAIIPITIYEDGTLIEDVRFLTLSGSETSVDSYSFYIVENGKKINYNIGEEVKAGTYEVLLEGKKRASKSVDWQIYSNGKWSEEWAIWGGEILYDDFLGSSLNMSNWFYGSVHLGGAVTVEDSFVKIDVSGSYTWRDIYSNYTFEDFGGFVSIYVNKSTGSSAGNNALYLNDTYLVTNMATGQTNITRLNETAVNVTIPSGTSTAVSVPNLNNSLIRFRSNWNTYSQFWIDKVEYGKIGQVNLVSPENDYGTNKTIVEINCSAQISDISSITNISLWTNQSGTFERVNYTTGLSGTFENVLFNHTFEDEGNYLWTCSGCNDDDECSFALENRTLIIDQIPPLIEITSPSSLENYGYVGQTTNLNYTITDLSPSSCWYDYNGTEVEVNCTEGNATFILETGNTNLTFYANDTAGNENSTSFNWTYKIFQNSELHSGHLYETENETYSINVTSNSSLTGIKLNWNASNYTMSNSGGGLWTYARDTPLGIGTKNFTYLFTYAGDTIESTNYSQYVNFTFFTPYNSTYTDIFLNISFKDEDDLSVINASVPTSSFDYYLGTGTVTKQLTFSNNTDNFDYVFSGTTGSENLKVSNISFQYKQGDSYPQRIWQPETQTYNSVATNQTLYLLNTADGLYVTYQVLTAAESPISGTEVKSTRQISGETIQIGAGTTDASGTITFWMNPDFQHTSTFNKTGYDVYTFTHFPTQSSYTITLGSTTTTNESCIRGISHTIKPSSDFLNRGNIYDFNYTIGTDYWDLTDFGFTITSDTGVNLGSDSSTSSSGGIVTANNINISNYSAINMNYYFTVDDDACSQITYTRTWGTQTSTGTQYGIWQLAGDFNTYISAGLFGFDNFGKTLISFVIVVLMVGGLSKRYGIASEGAIMGILFGIIFFLDVGLGFIPRVEIGDIVSIDHFFTFITFIILLGVIIREERH